MMLASALMIAALSINDAKMFFNGGDSMPNAVASVPGDSARGAALLPEIYGTVSGWLERMLLPPYGLYDADDDWMDTGRPVDPKASKFEMLWVISPSLCSNRVVSTRFTFVDLTHRIVDERLKFGGLSADEYGSDLFYGSSQMPGDPFPTVAWTNALFAARTPTEWSRVWTRLYCCPVDGVWKTQDSDPYYPSYHIAGILESVCMNNFVDQEIRSDFYDNYYWAIASSRGTQTTCLDLLRAQIGNDAYALSNRTMRLDRRFLTALENALGLMDLAEMMWIQPYMPILSLTHGYTEYASSTVAATWRYNASRDRISFTYDTPRWEPSKTWTTATNMTSRSESVVFACGGSAESVVVSAGLLDSIAVTVPLDLVLDLVGYSEGAPESVVELTSAQTSGGILTFRFDNGRSLGADLNSMVGTNRLAIAAVAHQTVTVWYTAGLSDLSWGGYDDTRNMWLLENGYIPHVDLAWLDSCAHADSPVAISHDAGMYPFAPESCVSEASSSQQTIDGTAVNLRSAIEGHIGTLIDHADGHVARATGRNIRRRASVLPAAGSFTPEGSGYASVASGGQPTINIPGNLIIKSSPSSGHVILTIDDGGGGDTRTVDYNVSSLDPENYPAVTLATISYNANAAVTNALPHVSAAYAGVNPIIIPRGHFRFRNLRFDD